MIKKAIHFVLGKAQIEHMDPKNNSFWMKGILDDSHMRYAFALEQIRKGRVLDIACGDGYGFFSLASSKRQVTGVDISEQAIEDAKKKYAKRNKNLAFVSDDAFHFLEKNNKQFDAIVSFETIEHVKDYKRFLVLLSKNLKKGGVCIISTPNKLFSDTVAGDTFNPFHTKEFYAKELVKLVSDAFGVKAKLFLQRPVKKNQLLLGIFKSLVLASKSTIIPEHKDYEGADIIVVVQK